MHGLPHDAHRLGPHVVGQRVVVRRLLRGETGPSGGPAMTDVLGVCTSWGDGGLRRRARVGGAGHDRRSPTSSPASRSRRARRCGTGCRRYDAELHALSLWPDLETEPLGDWLLRAAPPYEGRLRRRANSVLAMGEPGCRSTEALPVIVRVLRRPGPAALAQVELGSTEEADLFAAGWTPEPGEDTTS